MFQACFRRRHPVLIPLQKLERHPRTDTSIATNRFVVVDNDPLDVPELSLDKLQEPLSESRVIAVRCCGDVGIPAVAEPELNVLEAMQSSEDHAEVDHHFAQHGATGYRLRHQIETLD